MKTEFCIMPLDDRYSTTRFYGSERHELYEGRTGNRNKSIEDGLVIFITPEQHRGKKGIHGSPKEWLWLKELGQKTWQEYYNKTTDDFRKRYGRSYL